MMYILTFSCQKHYNQLTVRRGESIIMGDMNVNYLIENDHEVTKSIFTD